MAQSLHACVAPHMFTMFTSQTERESWKALQIATAVSMCPSQTERTEPECFSRDVSGHRYSQRACQACMSYKRRGSSHDGTAPAVRSTTRHVQIPEGKLAALPFSEFSHPHQHSPTSRTQPYNLTRQTLSPAQEARTASDPLSYAKKRHMGGRGTCQRLENRSTRDHTRAACRGRGASY